MPYRVEYSPKAKRSLKKLEKVGGDCHSHVLAKLAQLGENPRPPGSMQLASERGCRRVKVIDYRVVYTVCDDARRVRVDRIEARHRVYDRN